MLSVGPSQYSASSSDFIFQIDNGSVCVRCRGRARRPAVVVENIAEDKLYLSVEFIFFSFKNIQKQERERERERDWISVYELFVRVSTTPLRERGTITMFLHARALIRARTPN
jgi:hypothetical protein